MVGRHGRTSDQEAKTAQRLAIREQRARDERASKESRIKAERAMPAHNLLRRARACGIVVLEGGSVDYLLEGLEAAMHRRGDEPGTKRILPIKARNAIQGDDIGDGFGQEVLAQISRHRHAYGGLGVVAFMGFDFDDNTSNGNPRLVTRLREVMLKQSKLPSYTNDIDPAILLVGKGIPSHLPSHPDYVRADHWQHAAGSSIGELVTARIGLDATQELVLSAEFDPRQVLGGLVELYIPPFLEK